MRHVRPVFVVAALTLVGCGSDAVADRDATASTTVSPPTVSSPVSSGGVPTPTSPTTLDGGGGRPAAAASIVPAVDVIEVSSGRSVGLRSAVATDKPTLIWMWAPH